MFGLAKAPHLNMYSQVAASWYDFCQAYVPHLDMNSQVALFAAAAATVAIVACRRGRKVKDHCSVRGLAPCNTLADEDGTPTMSIPACTKNEDGSVSLSNEMPTELASNKLTLSRLKGMLKDMQGHQTVVMVVKELLSVEQGGALVVVYDCKGGRNAEDTMPVRSTEGGKLKEFMRSHARSLFASRSDGTHVNPGFRAVLRGSCASQGKWTKPALEDIAKTLGVSWDNAPASLCEVLDKPVDGALAILSSRGTVVGASSMIDITSRLDVLQPDGKGTRLRAAHHAMEWCRLKGLHGAAVVRSNDGAVTLVTVVEKCTRSFEIVKA